LKISAFKESGQTKAARAKTIEYRYKHFTSSRHRIWRRFQKSNKKLQVCFVAQIWDTLYNGLARNKVDANIYQIHIRYFFYKMYNNHIEIDAW